MRHQAGCTMRSMHSGLASEPDLCHRPGRPHNAQRKVIRCFKFGSMPTPLLRKAVLATLSASSLPKRWAAVFLGLGGCETLREMNSQAPATSGNSRKTGCP